MLKHINTQLCRSAAYKTTRTFYTYGASRKGSSNDHIIPSLSENDMGSLAFQNDTWRKNENWKSQFSSEEVPSKTTICSTRGLFGNLLCDENSHKQHTLNKVAFDTPNESSQRFIKFDMNATHN
ncbi:yfdF [Acrasis kona]|uniref:YfdF n=1 Tax=Acrasis kona TaxID=1008807 RepID=A0AAW2Z5J0_9EUKA